MDPAEVASSNAAAQQPQMPGAESTPPAAAPNDPRLDEWNDRFSKLTLKERGLMQREQKLKAALDRLNRLEQLKDDPDALLGEFGHSYDSLTKRRLEDPKTPAEQQFAALQAELQELKQKLSGREQAEQQETQQKQYQELLNRVNETIESGGESFEFIKAFGEQELVLRTAATYLQQTGRQASFEEVAGWVEKHLEERLERISNTKKFGAKFATHTAPATASPEQTAVNTAIAQSEARESSGASLTSGMSSSPTSADAGAVDERVLKRRAIDALKAGGWN